jgi:chitin disaccharide deacetylase
VEARVRHGRNPAQDAAHPSLAQYAADPEHERIRVFESAILHRLVNGKYLIVNGDDFGASPGVNRGILEAHESGILTSTSVMVDGPCSEVAASLPSEYPALGVGLHVVLSGTAHAAAEQEIERQLARFGELAGQAPTHLDSHHHVHRDPQVLPAFRAVAERHGLPLRAQGTVNFIGRFYAQWDGETHPEAISPQALRGIFETDLKEGFNELCCHPGRADDQLASSYLLERQTELETLCHTEVAAAIEELGIRLATFREVSRSRGA